MLGIGFAESIGYKVHSHNQEKTNVLYVKELPNDKFIFMRLYEDKYDSSKICCKILHYFKNCHLSTDEIRVPNKNFDIFEKEIIEIAQSRND